MVAIPLGRILSAKSVLDASWLCQLQSAGQHPFPAPQAAGLQQPLSRAWGSKAGSAQHSGAWAGLFESPAVNVGICCFASQFSAFVQHLLRSKTNPVCWYSTYQGPVFK